MADGKLLISQRIPLMHRALERMQVSYNGEHQQHPLLYPLVLANEEELIEQGCTFKLKSADLFVLPLIHSPPNGRDPLLPDTKLCPP